MEVNKEPNVVENQEGRFIAQLKERLSIRKGTNKQNTIKEVTKNIEFSGPTVWILIFSIFIASIGLNLNSTAVIIGAMLISPLMGPIVGIGLSIGTNNIDLLKKSLTNFAIMIAISLFSSCLYFLVTPLSEAQSELFARTKPTLLDVLVALFGGFAGIIAGSRDEKSNVVPGVAIATALMPPLCTAGYGLATWNLDFFFGAFYLFLLNSLFICISTFVIVRYLKFPYASFVNKSRETNVKRGITIVSILIIIPSVFIFMGIIRESIFKGDAVSFIDQHMTFTNTEVISSNIIYHEDTTSLIEVFLIGEILPQSRINELEEEMQAEGIENTELKINQARDNTESISSKLSEKVKSGIIEEIYHKNEKLIQSKDEKIKLLEDKLLLYSSNEINHKDLSNELKSIYDNMTSFSYAQMQTSDFSSASDTVFTVLVDWDKETNKRDYKKLNGKLSAFLKARLKVDSVRVIVP